MSKSDELLQIGRRCRELKKEKEMLRESQPESFELIKRLQLHVKSLSEARSVDKEHILKLERELINSSQEIDYLQDQLSARNEEVECLNEYLHNLELKLADMENIQDLVRKLEDELNKSNSERLLLIEEVQSKEEELENSAMCKEKLEEVMSFSALESQCEIESLKLDVMALEKRSSEVKKIQNENAHEKARMLSLIDDLKISCQNAQNIIEHLQKENKELREKLETSEINAPVFVQKIVEWMEKEDTTETSHESFVSDLERHLTLSKEMSSCGEVFGTLLSKMSTAHAPDINLKEKMESMSTQIHEYEVLVKQLKEELREEKLKAKEEAEDLAQEMAELRYQMTGLLEDECKRRACIEQASLQRIAELEAQIQKERKKCVAVGKYIRGE